MKIKLFVLILLITTAKISFAQLDDLLKKATEKVAKVELFEEKNVTTSIEDAVPVAFWLKDMEEYTLPEESDNYDFILAPGYYKYTLQSYCLKAGTNGPSKGDGYLLAPLKGKRSNLVYNIVSRSSEHPEIEQHDIQVLLWGIIYGTKFTDYSPEFQNKVKPLLTIEEIADLSLDIKNVPLDVMPEDIKKAAKFYQDFRQKLTNPNITYNEIEQMAMVPGLLPDDPFSKYVQKGLWAYIGNGFYSRAMPESYPKTIVEIYRPAKINVIRDDKKRLSSLEYNNNKIEITYDDEQGKDVIAFGSNGNYPIYRFKTIKLTGSNAGEEYIIENSGWMVKDKGEKLKGNTGQSYSGMNMDDPMFTDYQERIKNGKTQLKNFDDYMKEKKMQPLKDKQNEYWADYHTMQGLKKATNPLDKSGQLNWISKTLKLVTDWWNSSSSALAGEDAADNGSLKADIRKFPAVPATNGKQRIISSFRKNTSN